MNDNEAAPISGYQAALYANYFKVGHSALEFLLDFGEQYEGEPTRIHTRIVASPFYARALLHLLQEAFAAYESDLKGD